MQNVRIVLVGSKYEGNVGAVARSMANFDMNDLVLVDPCKIGDDAYRRAKHGYHILDSAVITYSIKDAVKDCSLVVGTSGIVADGNNNNYSRIPISARELKDRLSEYDGKIAILFGREDFGLLQEELDACDILVTVPASETYPVMNISHAATIVMYELFDADMKVPVPAGAEEKELMFKFFDELLDSIDYPEHRKESTSIMFRKLMGRSIPSKWEFHTMMGIFGGAAKRIRRNTKEE